MKRTVVYFLVGVSSLLYGGENTEDSKRVLNIDGGQLNLRAAEAFVGTILSLNTEVESQFAKVLDAHDRLKRLNAAPSVESLNNKALEYRRFAHAMEKSQGTKNEVEAALKEALKLESQADAMLKNIVPGTPSQFGKLQVAEKELREATQKLNDTLKKSSIATTSKNMRTLHYFRRVFGLCLVFDATRGVFEAYLLDPTPQSPEDLTLPHAQKETTHAGP